MAAVRGHGCRPDNLWSGLRARSTVAACGAVEALSRTLATEFGPAGIRVNCVRAGGMLEHDH